MSAQTMLLIAGCVGGVLPLIYLIDAFVHFVDRKYGPDEQLLPGLPSCAGFVLGGVAGGALAAYLIGLCISSNEIGTTAVLLGVIVMAVTAFASQLGCVGALQDTTQRRSPSWFFLCSFIIVVAAQAPVFLVVWVVSLVAGG